MPRDYKVYLDDILQAIAKVRRFTAGLTLDELVKDDKTLDALLRNLEVIGEAVKQIPSGVRSKHPEVEWMKIAGLRDILIHNYFGIDYEIVWDIVQSKLPVLERQVRKIADEPTNRTCAP